eukprot:COSAG02_NODE_1609_length_11697_cov_9.662269_2_plen_125_part_00
MNSMAAMGGQPPIEMSPGSSLRNGCVTAAQRLRSPGAADGRRVGGWRAVLLLLSCGFLVIDGCSDRFSVGYDGQVRAVPCDETGSLAPLPPCLPARLRQQGGTVVMRERARAILLHDICLSELS